MKTTSQVQLMAEAIQLAYINSISESKDDFKAKFKVGAKVGIGRYTGDGQYVPVDTGTVSKVSKNGDHEVTHDHQVQNTTPYTDDKLTPVVSKYNHAGYSVFGGDDKQIIDCDMHNCNVKDNEDMRLRSQDLGEVMKHLQSKSNYLGHFQPLDKSHADHLKALIDKHTKD